MAPGKPNFNLSHSLCHTLLLTIGTTTLPAGALAFAQDTKGTGVAKVDTKGGTDPGKAAAANNKGGGGAAAAAINNKGGNGVATAAAADNKGTPGLASIGPTIKGVSDIHNYSINLMWINKTLNPNQKFVSTAGSEDDCLNKLLMPVLKWAEANPLAKVFLWYDGSYTPQGAVTATQHLLQGQLEKRHLSNLELRDIRSIKIVASNPDCFSDQLPMYFRVDLLKAIIVLNSVENEKNDSAIFADLEVGDLRADKARMGKAELFPANLIGDLINQGLLVNEGFGRYENQFLQLIRNDRMQFAIKHTLINVNMLRAVTALNSHNMQYILGLGNAPFVSTTLDVFQYFRGTAPGLSIKVNPRILNKGKRTDPWLDYDPKRDGYAPFGLYFIDKFGYGIQPDPDDSNAWLSKSTMIRFPAQADSEIPQIKIGRDVEVRNGNFHTAHESDVVSGKPASGAEYRCMFWE